MDPLFILWIKVHVGEMCLFLCFEFFIQDCYLIFQANLSLNSKECTQKIVEPLFVNKFVLARCLIIESEKNKEVC